MVICCVHEYHHHKFMFSKRSQKHVIFELWDEEKQLPSFQFCSLVIAVVLLPYEVVTDSLPSPSALPLPYHTLSFGSFLSHGVRGWVESVVASLKVKLCERDHDKYLMG